MNHLFRNTESLTLPLVTILFITVQNSAIPVNSSAQDQRTAVQEYDWRVTRVFPHDTTAFTQGLIFRDGYLYESTGRRGKSEIRKVRLESGEILQRKPIGDEYFGEGLTSKNDQLIQLTLNSGVGFVYNIDTFERDQTFRVEGEAWGLTNSDQELIMSDGSSSLRFINPETYKENRRITVTLNDEPVSKLNELEMIGDRIFANRLFSEEILMIDPASGEVTGRIDLERLVTSVKSKDSVSVLNGIAYDSSNDRIFITGKLWPNIYEIEIRLPE